MTRPRLDLSTVLQWPALYVEELLRLPETMRQVREVIDEQARLVRNLNEAAELMLRMAKRVESVLPDDSDSVAGVGDALARVHRVERAVDEIGERMLSLLGRWPGGRRVQAVGADPGPDPEPPSLPE